MVWKLKAVDYHEHGVMNDGRRLKRPDDLTIPAHKALHEQYQGRAWWMRDYWRDGGAIIPLDSIPQSPQTMDAAFAQAALKDHVDQAVPHRIEHGHDNLSECDLVAIFQAPWKGAYRDGHHKFVSKSFQKESEKNPPWYLGPDEHPPIWPPRVEPINCVEQAQGEPDGLPVATIDPSEFEAWADKLVEEMKNRGTTDKGHGESAVNAGIDMDAIPLTLPTNRQHARNCAILQEAESGKPASPRAGESSDDPSSIEDDDLVYQWKIDLTAAYRQLIVATACLWMCMKFWAGYFYLDLRCQFGDASMVEAFQSVSVAILTFVEKAIDGDVESRALLDLPASVWHAIDKPRVSARLQDWVADRLRAGLPARQVRRYKTVVYIDDYLGSVVGRRFGYAVALVTRRSLNKFGFETKPEKECLPARSMLALGGLTSLDEPRGLSMAPVRQLRYYKQLKTLYGARSCRTEVLEIVTARMISASLYHVTGRPWVTAHNTALKQAKRRAKGRATLGDGVRAEQRFWLQAYQRPVRLALFPIEHFPKPSESHNTVFYFDASSEIGMGGVALFADKESGKLAAFYWYSRWSDGESYHINCKESLAGYAALRAAFPVAQDRYGTSLARFCSPLGDNMTQIAGSRNNSTKNILTAEILRAQGEYVLEHSIVLRPTHVPSAENLSDPLSREKGDGEGLKEFFTRSRAMKVTTFSEVSLPRDVAALRRRLRALHAAKEAPESEFAERVADADRTGAAASPDEWTYIHAFCGLDAGREAFAPLGGRPAGACDVSVSVRKLWNHLTGLKALSSFELVLAMAREGRLEQHWNLLSALVYLSGAPCIDFSTAGVQRGVDGATGQLFLDDVELALLLGLTIVVKEIVPGILQPHLRPVLDAALRALSQDGRYMVNFRLLCCRRHGDIYTTRERVFVVAVLKSKLKSGVTAQDFFPAEERPSRPGRVMDILRRAPRAQELAGLDASRVEWLPEREADDSYDGLRLVGRYDGSSEIGHHVYSVKGPAPTQRTGGTGPGLGTGLFWDGEHLFRLSPEQSLAVQSCDPFLYFKASALGISDAEIYCLAGNTIPVKTLRALVQQLLSLLRW